MDAENELMTLEGLANRVSEATMEAIRNLGFTSLTEIQAMAIPPLLDKRDLRGTAKTGSGKTLAFLVPAIERLSRKHFKATKGVGVLILSPTRELARQIFSVAEKLASYHNYSCGLVTGGKHKGEEAEMLAKGINILIATPGRLLHHVKNTPNFSLKHVKCLILDEADKMLDTGFEEDMKQILNIVESRKQTMLFSATKTPKTNEIVKVALREDFVDIDVTRGHELVTADGLKQGYIVCPTEKKFLLLCTYLRKLIHTKKVMVFFNCCVAVKYYQILMKHLGLNVLAIHGQQPQSERDQAFDKFKRQSQATLLCTDVAARGWDIPGVDIVIQYDPPIDASEYIHRVGRTARGNKEGEAVLILREKEIGFVKLLHQRRVIPSKIEYSESVLPDIQHKIEEIVDSSASLKFWARKAFAKHLESYVNHKRKDIFNAYGVDLKCLIKTFGLKDQLEDLYAVTSVDLNLQMMSDKRLTKKLKESS